MITPSEWNPPLPSLTLVAERELGSGSQWQTDRHKHRHTHTHTHTHTQKHTHAYISLRNIWHSHINRSRWWNVGILFLTGANRLRRIHYPFLLHYRIQISIRTDKPFKAYSLCDAPTGLTFNNCTVFMCFVFIWEQTATCATYSIYLFVFITEMKSVYSAVRTGSFYSTLRFVFKWLNHHYPFPFHKCA
jgi:hypothetical protein